MTSGLALGYPICREVFEQRWMVHQAFPPIEGMVKRNGSRGERRLERHGSVVAYKSRGLAEYVGDNGIKSSVSAIKKVHRFVKVWCLQRHGTHYETHAQL